MGLYKVEDDPVVVATRRSATRVAREVHGEKGDKTKNTT